MVQSVSITAALFLVLLEGWIYLNSIYGQIVYVICALNSDFDNSIIALGSE